MGITTKMMAKPSARCGASAPSLGADGANVGGGEDGQGPSSRPRGLRRVASLACSRLGAVLAYTAACFGTAGCEADSMEISHPTADNIPVDGSVVGASEIPTGLAGEELDDWLGAMEALRRSEVVVTIGKLGEVGDNDEEVFGWVADAKFDAVGNVVVLDRLAQRVTVFDPDGRFLTKFGRSGEGPGEFGDAVALAILSSGRIAVADGRRHLEIFAEEDGEYVYASRHPFPADLYMREGLCQAGDRLFLSVWQRESNAVVHEVPRQPTHAGRTFGQGYMASYALARQLLSDGPIGCVGDPLLIVHALNALPVLRAYGADDGSEAWTARVADYVQGQIVEDRATGSIAYGSGLKDMAVSVTGVGEQYILYQTVRGERAAPEELEVRSYLVDATSGNGALVSTSLPIVSDVTDTHILGYWVTGIPRVEVRRLAPPQRVKGE